MQIKQLDPFVFPAAKESAPGRARGSFGSGTSVLTACAAGAAAFMLTNVRIGGALSPFGASLAAALPPIPAAAAFFGGMLAALTGSDISACAAEISASAVLLLYSAVLGRKSSYAARCAMSGIVYFICSCAFGFAGLAAGSGWALFIASALRSVMCAAFTLCVCRVKEAADRRQGKQGENSAVDMTSLGIFYMLLTAALCAREIGFINPGRAAAGFCTAVMARRFGVKGGAAGGVLSACAFLLAAQPLGRCGAILAFAGLAAGMYSRRGKFAVNIAFICAAFGMTAAAGMPSGTAEFIADMGIAAAVYCLVPERLYLPAVNELCAKKDPSCGFDADRLRFAAQTLGEVGNDIETASELLARCGGKSNKGIDGTVKDKVCRQLCTQSVCSAACGGLSSDIMDGCFRTAAAVAERTGSITCRELPAGFEGCPKKAEIADLFSLAVSLRKIQSRKDAYIRRFLECSSEQLSAAAGMIASLSERAGGYMREDSALSEAFGKLLAEEGAKVSSAKVYYDEAMNPFAEAFLNVSEECLQTFCGAAGDRLAALLGTELAQPCTVSCGAEGNIIRRIRWRGQSKYIPDCHIISCAAESGVCGDSNAQFDDGTGNFYVILADGMGKGVRAAAESSMAVNLLRRLILSGADRASAVRTLNVLLSAASSDEIFTTLDILTVNCYSGECRLMKLGSAPTTVLTRCASAPVISVYSDCSAPLGIISRIDASEELFFMDENSRAIMLTDGADCESGSFVSALLENEGLTCRQLAERIIARTDEIERESDEKMRRRDDKTAAAIRLYAARG
ncbi:MAG: SpoIIE family protein phosphatase [Ruminococcus sp.]|nr:SpoIIE family protein phosphatase [Ruminococcus sp.]